MKSYVQLSKPSCIHNGVKCAFLSLALLLNAAFAFGQTHVTLSIPDTLMGAAGDTIEAPVFLSKRSNVVPVAALGAAIKVKAGLLSYVDFEAGPIVPGFLLNVHAPQADSIRLAYLDFGQGPITQNGLLATLRFRIVSTAAAGAVDSLCFHELSAADDEGADLPVLSLPGKVTIAPANQGLVAWYKFENNTADSSGNDHHGTPFGNPQFVNGLETTALQFDGIDDYVNVLDHPQLRPGNGSWTISLWAKPPDLAQHGPLVSKRRPTAGFKQYALLINGPNFRNRIDGRRFYFAYVQDDFVSERLAYTSDDVVDGNWHHIVAVADQAANLIRIHVDGIAKQLVPLNNGAWPTIDNPEPLRIGANSDASDFVDSIIDEVRIYNRALTPQEIQDLFDEGAAPAISVAPLSHDFGDVEVGASATQTFTIMNMGVANLEVSSTAIIGDADFSVTAGAAPFTVVPGNTHQVIVNFSPSSAGTKSVTLRIASNDPFKNPFDVPLRGNAFVRDSLLVGRLDAADCVGIAGWARDEDSPVTALEIRIYKDALFGQGGVFMDSTIANIRRGDLPYPDQNHGFSLRTPDVLRTNQPEIIFVYAVSVDANGNPTGAMTLLPGSPMTIVCDPNSNRPPEGRLDSLTCDFITGWARDPDSPASHLFVSVYKGGLFSLGGELIASGIANVQRTDLPFPDQDHGFHFPTPNALKTGVAEEIYVYATGVDANGSADGQVPLLAGVPQTIVCPPVIVQGWQMPLTVTNLTTNVKFDLAIGGDSLATDGFDSGLDIVAPPPLFTYNAHFSIDTLPNFLSTDMRRWVVPYVDAIEWKLVITNANGVTSEVCWESNELPPVGSFTLSRANQSIDMRAQSCLQVAGNDTLTIRYENLKTFTFDFPVVGGAWYLISLPVIPQDSSLTALFPNAVAAFRWDFPSQTARPVTHLRPGEGYWLLMLQAGQVQVSGRPFTSYCKNYSQRGWDIIGAVSDTAEVIDNPDGSVIVLFEWNPATGQAIPVDPPIVTPGRGYWALIFNVPSSIAVGESGMLAAIAPHDGKLLQSRNQQASLSDIPMQKASTSLHKNHGGQLHASKSRQEWSVPIKVKGTASTIDLTICTKTGATDTFDVGIDTPAPPPLFTFAAAFRITKLPNLLLQDCRDAAADSLSWQLALFNSNGAASTLKWDASEVPSGDRLLLISGNQTVNMLAQDSLQVTGDVTCLIKYERDVSTEVEEGRSPALPTEYALQQNYPNPFNPETVIPYQLPNAGYVTLKVYNMLGQEVRTLVDGHKPAGYQKVIWNGRDEAGRQLESGTYFIRLQAGRSVITRKLTLLK